MGILRPVDVSPFPVPDEALGWRIYLLAISAALGFAMFGYDVGFIGSAIALPSFKTRFGLNTSASTSLSANIVSVFLAGAFFAAPLIYPVAERFGRKICILIAASIFLLGSILSTVAPTLAYIYAGRVLTGLGVGISSFVVPIYISECAPPVLRGRLVGIVEVLLQSWQIVGFWINYGTNKHIPATTQTQWRFPFAFQIIPAGLTLLFMVWQPETPRFLIKSQKREEAQKVLSRIRNLPLDHEYILYEIEQIDAQLRDELHATGGDASVINQLRILSQPTKLKRLAIGFFLMTFLALTGVNSINYFSPTIIKGIGFTGTNVSLLATGIYGLVKGTFNIIYSLFIIDTVGRRKPLMWGGVVAAFCLFYIAIYSAVSHSFSGTATVGAGAYVSLVMIFIYAVAVAMSWTGIPWIYCAEIFPLEIRAVSVTMTTMVQWLVQFAIVYATPYMMKNITYGAFIFFGVMTSIGVVIVYFFVPETSRLALEEMELLFSQQGTAATVRRKTEEILAARRVAGVTRADSDIEKEVC